MYVKTMEVVYLYMYTPLTLSQMFLGHPYFTKTIVMRNIVHVTSDRNLSPVLALLIL
jgi:hypothetical protein